MEKNHSATKIRIYTILIVICLYLISASIPYQLWIKEGNIVYLLNIITRAIVLIIIFIYLYKNGLLNFRFKRPKTLHLLFLPLFLLCFSNHFVGWYQGAFNSTLFNGISLLKGMGLYILVAIGEEICFRGLLLDELIKHMKSGYAILVSSVIFGLIHLLNISALNQLVSGLIQSGYAIVLGIITGTIYYFGNNIIYPIIFHFMFNIFNDTLFKNLYTVQISTSYYLINITIGAIVLIYAGMLYLYLEKKHNVS